MTFHDAYGNLWHLRNDLIYGGRYDPDAVHNENRWRIVTATGEIPVRNEMAFETILKEANIT